MGVDICKVPVQLHTVHKLGSFGAGAFCVPFVCLFSKAVLFACSPTTAVPFLFKASTFSEASSHFTIGKARMQTSNSRRSMFPREISDRRTSRHELKSSSCIKPTIPDKEAVIRYRWSPLLMVLSTYTRNPLAANSFFFSPRINAISGNSATVSLENNRE